MKSLSEIFGTLRNPCIYIRASKACRTCEDHEYSELWDSQNSFIKHFQGYLDIFRDIDAYSATFTCAQLGRKGEASPVIFENWKICPDFGKKDPDCDHLWVKLSIQNMVLKVSRRKNFKMVPNGGSFSWVFWRINYRNALDPTPAFLRNTPS